jgi:hypothetical protein
MSPLLTVRYSFRRKTAGSVNVTSYETDGVGISLLAGPVSTFHRDLIQINSLSDFQFHLYLTANSDLQLSEVKKVKLSLYQAVEAHRVMRCQGSHIFYTIGSLIVRLSALRTSQPLHPGRFLVLISVRG